jgi:hypothetical protein
MISEYHRRVMETLKEDVETTMSNTVLESSELGGTELPWALAIAALRELADWLQHNLDNPLPPETGGDPWDRIGDVDEAQEWRDFDPEA